MQFESGLFLSSHLTTMLKTPGYSIWSPAVQAPSSNATSCSISFTLGKRSNVRPQNSATFSICSTKKEKSQPQTFHPIPFPSRISFCLKTYTLLHLFTILTTNPYPPRAPQMPGTLPRQILHHNARQNDKFRLHGPQNRMIAEKKPIRDFNTEPIEISVRG